MPIDVLVSTREPKRTVKQSIEKPIRRTVASESTNQKPRHTNRKLYENVSKTCSFWYPKFTPPGYNLKPKSEIGNVYQNLVEIILFSIDSGCSKHMMGNLKLLINFVEKFLGMVKFENDQIETIIGYRDLVEGVVTIKRVYYVERLNHNLFFVGQFCDADLEVAFWKSTCYIRDLKGNDILTGSYEIDLYSITLQDTSSPNPIFIMAKATSTKMPIDVLVSTREPKRTVKQSIEKPIRRTVASESTNQKPRHTNRKLYENVSKTCSFWYPKFTPPGYNLKPKSEIGNVYQNVSMPLGNASRTANILEPMTPKLSIVSKTTLYSNSFAARRDYPIQHRLWVLKAHDGKS
nr:integrase, catalytic region, zinc finger, CCHC-type, peptidase aspartic, catalytic [Tanacetum cinerariifolium]